MKNKLSNFDYKLGSYQFDDLYLNDLRLDFVRAFPIEFIQNQMELDDYIEGKDNKNAFCYRLEFGLGALGSIRGANASKFGIYYSKKQKQYKITKAFNVHNDLKLSFNKLKHELVRLLKAGENKEIETVEEIKLSPMVKGKILSIYYPKEYLNIFSNEMLSYFLKQLYDSEYKDYSLFQKQELLLKAKEQDQATRNWDNIKFGNYLYHVFPEASQLTRTNKSTVKSESPVTKTSSGEAKHEVNIIKAFEKQPLPSPNLQKSKDISLGKIDYLKKQKEDLYCGNLGERVVLQYETKRLKEHPELVRKIRHVSLESDAEGYDILSFDSDGTCRHIEVKSTDQAPSDAFSFILTENEKQNAEKLDNYWIYRVFSVKTKPVIYKIRNPFRNTGNINLEPIRYRAVVRVKDEDSD